MTGDAPPPRAVFEVVEESGGVRTAPVTATPFRVGRAADGRNDLVLSDPRVSRQAMAVAFDGADFLLTDQGQRHGLFVNGRRVERPQPLADGDVVTFGQIDAVRLVFRLGEPRASLRRLLSRFDEPVADEHIDHDLRHLNLLLEATALLQARLPYAEVLGAMVDRAITITDAERGVLLEAGETGLRPLVGRGRGGYGLPPDAVAPSQTAIDRALAEGRALIAQDVDRAADELKLAASIVGQQLRAVIAVPLYASARAADPVAEAAPAGVLLGVLYLDSRRPAAFSGLRRQILDALAIEAASVIDHARAMERERERRQMEQDLVIARDIQQRLLPRQLQSYRFMELTGVNRSCHSVGGDYFDVVELAPGKVSFVIADVSGKGLPAALLTAMLQGGFAGITLTPDPARLMEHLNRYVWARSEANRFASVFMGVLDETGRFDYVSAGHPSPLLVHAGEVETPFPPESFPVGVFPDARFRVRSRQLEPGDTLILFTDGVDEARNPQDEEFGRERLVRTVRAAAAGRVEDLAAAILEAVVAFSGDAPPADDMTLLVVRYTG